MKKIRSRENFEGEFTLPGDKSLTHRAIMLNSIAEGEGIITNVSTGEDCLSTARCMRVLGAKIQTDGTTFRVIGNPDLRSGAELNCGNSATTMRLLTGILAGKGVDAKLYGDTSLSQRPMERVARPLSSMGALVQTTNGKPPVLVTSSNLKGRKILLDVPSAQVKSAILLAGLNADGETVVTEPIKTRDHTERMLKKMGADIQTDGLTVRIRKSRIKGTDFEIPSDISTAVYFMALGALKGKTLCKNVGINPTRTGILKAFDKLGVKYSLSNQKTLGGEEIADILVEKSYFQPIEIEKKDIPSMIDELPVIALLCAFADGESRIAGARELKVKESNRILATAELVNALGGECLATEDGFIIRGKGGLQGGKINACGDHRIAMTGAVGLIASKQGGYIQGADVCAVSFPHFFECIGE